MKHPSHGGESLFQSKDMTPILTSIAPGCEYGPWENSQQQYLLVTQCFQVFKLLCNFGVDWALSEMYISPSYNVFHPGTVFRSFKAVRFRNQMHMRSPCLSPDDHLPNKIMLICQKQIEASVCATKQVVSYFSRKCSF